MKIKLILFIPHIFKIVFLSLAVAVFTNAHAQLNSENLIQFTERDGLPGAQVQGLVIDKSGYVWIGTNNGLTRFDGYEFKRFYFDPNDTATIHGLAVTSLFEDRKGQIWAGTGPSWLNAYDPVTKAFRQFSFTHLINHPATVEMNIRVMYADNNGRIYFGVDTYYGDEISSALLYKDENSDSVKNFITPDSLNIKNVYRIRKDITGNMWLLTYSGMFKIDTKGILSAICTLDTEFTRINDFPADFQFDKEGHLWIITQKLTLFEFNPQTVKYKTWVLDTLHISKEYFYLLKNIIIDKNDNIWIGTNDGIQFFNRETGTFSVFNNGFKKALEHTPVNELAIDDFGTVWIGTNADGVIKYEEKPQLKSYTFNKGKKNSLTSGWANFIYESSDGKIWITTGGSNLYSGINILDPRTGNVTAIPYPTFKSRINGISGIWEKTPGEMYLGVYNGLYTFSEKTHLLKRVNLAGIPDTTNITFQLKDCLENEWICTSGRGLYKKSKEAQQFKKYDLSLIKGSNATSNEITHVYESKKHGLWILTNNGLFLYNYTIDKIDRHGYDKNSGDIFVTQDINSFYEDPQGIAWIGTWNGGLSRYDVKTKKIKTYTRNDGLPSMSIQAILADEQNNALWLSTFDGLSRFNIKTEQFSNFSIADGIQSQLFADGSFLKTSTGLFAFGGSNGITIFNPNEINKTSIPPKVFLTDLKLFNKSIMPGEKSILKKQINETEQITLAYDQNNISIDFIALHYSNPSKNRYSYKLENYDNEWRDIGNLNTAFYPNLPPGRYIFRVKAANDKGVWNEKGATLKITVNPPWWNTAWAYIIYGLLFIALAFNVDRYLRRKVIEKEKERNRASELRHAKEIERAYHELEESHETLKATQSQLIQSEKMASLGELTAGIAHEIQNPLNFVNNFSEVSSELVEEMKVERLKVNGERDEAHENEILSDLSLNLKKITHHGKRADAIVKGMLQHSRTSTGLKELTDINALADEYLRLAYYGLRAKDKDFNAEFETDFAESIGKIEVVPQDIGRVLLNLYNNAFYAVKEKTASTSSAGQPYEPTVSVTTKKENDKVIIAVKDNGIGIPQKIADKIFQPFFTTKPTGQGTGLGLSLSYDIIKAHKGEIRVESKEGEGCKFIIQLPS